MNAPAARLGWTRIVLGGVLAHLVSIVLIAAVGWLYLTQVPQDWRPADFPAAARQVGLVLGPILGALLAFLFARWAALTSPGRERLAGTLVGSIAALFVVVLLVNGSPGVQVVYALSIVLKIAAGVAGGAATARKLRTPGAAALLVALAASMAAGQAVAAAQPADASGVMAAEEAIRSALVSGSLDDVAGWLDDGLTLSHAGIIQTKQEWLGALRSGAMRYLSIANADQRVRLFEQTAVVTGRRAVRLSWGGSEHNPSLQYTAVYHYGDGRWKLVAYHSDELRTGGPPGAR